MKFILDVATALPVFNQALKTCNTKADDTDASFLFSENKNSLWITSINEKAEQIIKLPVVDLEADAQESFFVNGQAITEFFRQFSDDEAECECDGKILTMKGTVKDINFTFPVASTENYAPRNYVAISTPIECDAQAFAETLRQTSFCCSTEDNSVTNGLRIQIMGDKLISESTDDERIAVYEVEIEDIGLNAISFILHKSMAEILATLLSDVVSVSIEKGRSHIRFCWNDTILTAQLIDDSSDDFPEVTEFIEGDIQSEMVISRAELIQSLKMTGLVAKDTAIRVQASANGLRLSISEANKGSGVTNTEAQKVTGKTETSVVFKHFLQGVLMTTSPWITLEFRDLSFADICGMCIKDGEFRNFILPAVIKSDEEEEDQDE